MYGARSSTTIKIERVQEAYPITHAKTGYDSRVAVVRPQMKSREILNSYTYSGQILSLPVSETWADSFATESRCESFVIEPESSNSPVYMMFRLSLDGVGFCWGPFLFSVLFESKYTVCWKYERVAIQAFSMNGLKDEARSHSLFRDCTWSQRDEIGILGDPTGGATSQILLVCSRPISLIDNVELSNLPALVAYVKENGSYLRRIETGFRGCACGRRGRRYQSGGEVLGMHNDPWSLEDRSEPQALNKITDQRSFGH